MCVFGAPSSSHTHSEPRIVIIFSKLLQTDRQTDRMDGETDVHRETGRERDQIGDKEEGWRQGPSSYQPNEGQRQETSHHSTLRGKRIHEQRFIIKMADREEEMKTEERKRERKKEEMKRGRERGRRKR